MRRERRRAEALEDRAGACEKEGRHAAGVAQDAGRALRAAQGEAEAARSDLQHTRRALQGSEWQLRSVEHAAQLASVEVGQLALAQQGLETARVELKVELVDLKGHRALMSRLRVRPCVCVCFAFAYACA